MKTKAITNTAMVALMTAVITICSWITIPFTIPFTLQTFAVFLSLLILDGISGTVSILIFILLGLVGVPVFSGFASGPAVVFGPTGGYIIGFIACGVIYILTKKLRKNTASEVITLLAGLIVCYAIGTIWFSEVMAMQGKAMGITAVLTVCVFPFVIPDIAKLALAVIISKRVKKVLPKITAVRYNEM